MALNKELSTAIEHCADEHISEWINQYWGKCIINGQEIREKILRVEESLECQSALRKQDFEKVDKRFEAVDKRFEAVDKRFEDVNNQFRRVYKFVTGLLIATFGAILALAAPLWPGG